MNTPHGWKGPGAEIARQGMELVKEGKVRNHMLGNTATVHSGTVEWEEYQQFRDFLPGKNCCMLYELTGRDDYE